MNLKEIFDDKSIEVLKDMHKYVKKNLPREDLIVFKALVLAWANAVEENKMLRKKKWHTPFTFFQVKKSCGVNMKEFTENLLFFVKKDCPTFRYNKEKHYGKLI